MKNLKDENIIEDCSNLHHSFVFNCKYNQIEEQEGIIKSDTEAIDKIKQESDRIKIGLDEALKNIKEIEKEIEKSKKQINN